MLPCLLCQKPNPQRKRFSDIFFMQEEKQGACLSCKESFEKITGACCFGCHKPGIKEMCKDCCYWRDGGKEVDHVSIYSYTEKMSDYFSCYKFQGDYLLRKVFAKELREALKKYQNYTIVPIPLSASRLEERGFNQVTGLLEAAGISYLELLEKDEVSKQSDKSRKERLALEQPFSLKEGIEVPDRILLVDDIYTTGATLQLAKEVFMKINRKDIKTFSLAR